MSEELDLQAILSQDNPEIDVFTTAVQEPAPVVVAAEETQEPRQPEPQPETTDDLGVKAPEDPREANAFAQMRRALEEKAELRAQLAAQEAVAARDREWQQYQQQQQQTAAANDEIPDAVLEPEAHAAWVRDQISREVAKVRGEFEQREQARQQQEYARHQQTLIAAAGQPTETISAAVEFIRAKEPWMIEGLGNAPNPYAAAVEYAARIGFAGATPATQAKPTTSAISDDIRKQVLAEEAARRAAAGTPPQMQTPRGVGSAPSGAGFSDSLPPPSEYSKLGTAEYEAIKAKILSQ